MRYWRTLGRVVLIAVALTAIGSSAAAHAQDGADDDNPPTLLIAPNRAKVGTRVEVVGNDWPASRLVSLEVCGNGGVGGSVHCDQRTATTVSTGRDGHLQGEFTLGLPPSPCPCVVHAYIATDHLDVSTSVQLVDAEMGPVVAPPEARNQDDLRIKAAVRNAGGWQSWFGAPADRVLALDVSNLSDVPIEGARVEISWGRGDDPSELVTPPVIPSIPPGGTIHLEVPVQLHLMALGGYEVRGSAAGHPEATFSTETSAWPFGLLLIPALLIALLLVIRSRRAVARRVLRDSDPEMAAALIPPGKKAAAARARQRAEREARPRKVRSPLSPRVERGLVVGTSVLVLLLSAGLGSFLVGRGPSGDELSEVDLCAHLTKIDFGESLGGDDEMARALALVDLANLEGRVPEEAAAPIEQLAAEAESRSGLEDLSAEALEDPDRLNEVYKAVYRLEFEPSFRDASATLELYAINACGMDPSGRFDLVVDAKLDDSLFPGLDLSNFNDPVFEFSPAALGQHNLPPIENPTFDFDRSDYDQYQLDLSETEDDEASAP